MSVILWQVSSVCLFTDNSAFTRKGLLIFFLFRGQVFTMVAVSEFVVRQEILVVGHILLYFAVELNHTCVYGACG